MASPLAPFQRAPFQTHCNTDSARVRTGADGGSARTRFNFHKHAVKTRCRPMSGDGRAWIQRWVTVRVSNIPTPAVRTGTGPGENCPGFFHYIYQFPALRVRPESRIVHEWSPGRDTTRAGCRTLFFCLFFFLDHVAFRFSSRSPCSVPWHPPQARPSAVVGPPALRGSSHRRVEPKTRSQCAPG